MVPAKLVEFAVPTVSALPPSATVVPATPDRSLIVWLMSLPEISNRAPTPARVTPLDEAMLPLPTTASTPLARTVVAPV
jgi:hypothetical protein